MRLGFNASLYIIVNLCMHTRPHCLMFVCRFGTTISDVPKAQQEHLKPQAHTQWEKAKNTMLTQFC